MINGQNYVSNKLSPIAARLIQRIPSVKERDLNIDQLLEKNEIFVLYGEKGNFLQCIFYKVFDDFVYMHATIGKDSYKDEAFYKLFDITTKLGTSYCVMFNSPKSIESIEKYGGKQLQEETLNTVSNDLLNAINRHTGRGFYKEEGKLYDKTDRVKTKNPFFMISRDAYEKAVSKLQHTNMGLKKLLNRYKSSLGADYTTYSPKIESINEVYKQLVVPLLGKNILSQDSVKSFLVKNTSSLTIGSTRNRNSYHFFYCFLPLSKEVFYEMKQGKKGVFDLTDKDISQGETEFTYFAGGGGLSVKDRAAGLIHCANRINNYSYLLSTPVSNEGLAFLKKVGFQPVDSTQASTLNVLHILHNKK